MVHFNSYNLRFKKAGFRLLDCLAYDGVRLRIIRWLMFRGESGGF